MSGHLLAVAVGPVQEFIAAARRTRDLWFGSHLLSEISKAAAQAMAAQCDWQHLVFPAPESAAKLDRDSELAVANVLLAELPAGIAPVDVAHDARGAAEACWRRFASQALDVASGKVRTEIWQSQVDDVVEFYAAWVPMTSASGYKTARQRVMRLLAGRKACRDFRAPSRDWPGIPKSSLDGARETVLHKQVRTDSRLRLAEGEQLDAVGLTKRLAAGKASYPSVARIAADPWLRGVGASPAAAEFERLRGASEGLARLGILGRIDIHRHPQFQDFPYEGTAVYATRHCGLAEENGRTAADLGDLPGSLKALTGQFGDPNPYLAVLMADGDRMGAAIAAIESAAEHRRLSRQLARFAATVRQIVADCHGTLVYAGGDDVLAFLPTDRALACGRRLSDRFCELLKEWSRDDRRLSLSVGIGIGHFMEPLEDLLDYGRQAEKLAKRETRPGANDDRNGLAVQFHPRGGAPLSVRRQWRGDDTSLDCRLLAWAELLRLGQLPHKVAYDLR